MSAHHCLNNKSHYLPFLTLRHGVANFFSLPDFKNLFCINPALRHRVVNFSPISSLKSILHESHFATSCRKVLTWHAVKRTASFSVPPTAPRLPALLFRPYFPHFHLLHINQIPPSSWFLTDVSYKPPHQKHFSCHSPIIPCTVYAW